MNLDDLFVYPQVDPQNMLGEIGSLPDQLEQAWALGQRLPLPEGSFARVVMAGMGSSGIGAELVAAYVEPFCAVPVVVHRDYGLPGWARGPETLVIALSYSGETEEVLSALEAARENGCACLVMATGGALVEKGRALGAMVWTFEHPAPQRAALGYAAGLGLATLSRLGLVGDLSGEVAGAVAAMRAQAERLGKEIPAVKNPAKRYGGQLMGRWAVFIGAEFLVPVARRWKVQVNELAKAWAQFETLPELDHNGLAGVLEPEALFSRTMTMFLNAPGYHPRNMLRSELTRHVLMMEGIPTDFYLAQGEGRLAQQWTALHFGDYMAYYLAIAYGVDPTPVEVIEAFKEELRGRREN